jgi:hypothetical protein
MGRTTQPKYRIEISCIHFANKRREVHTFAFTGKPSTDAAMKYRNGMNDSMKPNGNNSHLAGLISPYGTAQIIEQKTGFCVAEYKPPMFEVIN